MTLNPSPRAAAARKFTAGLAAWFEARGLDPDSEALSGTPGRVLRALDEFTAGYEDDPARHLARVFPVEHSGQPIAVTGVPFTALCEHHMLPFSGTADIAYLPKPGAPVAGLSKLPRVLDVYAKRLQTQEQITKQVTAALDEHLQLLGAACIIRSEHGCLALRGARKPGSQMVTASYTGVFYEDPQARAELHTLFNARA
ncbi:GTP cyclohydrolase I [Streptomyces sp. Ag109_O5-1]|uniref:GTP cyclohydrolase I n=1 Tax=Streptomyces sp. Ag109_O5-1 TaxID=1938851 RepID=UPI000F515A1A|nr:GTP cyclohydrolase I [Streptomyces sp. Ag109_O5-1]RPE39757.1 GTP cyclohydrolase I [Streptomyces sp. Ag109_O5-1]